MRKIPLLLVIVAATLAVPAVASADTIYFRGSNYAAIAYSQKTGKYGYAYNHGSRGTAEAVALRGCKADDAKIVCWARNGFCALAVGDDGAYGIGYSYGDGATNRSAKLTALEECKKRSKNARLLLCVCSLDMTPEIFDR